MAFTEHFFILRLLVPMDNILSMGIASILAVIHESNHAHFLTSFCSDKVSALWHKVNTFWHKKQP